MSVYTIGDLHLSVAKPDKSMEVFGRRWAGYTEKIQKNWERIVSSDDTVVIPGDISWGLTLEEAERDLAWIHALPGKKLLGKGNHDFFWSTMSKMEQFVTKNGYDDISFLYNNAFIVEDFILTGTRGWFADPSGENIPEGTDYTKLVLREASRLRLSLEAASRLKEEAPEKEIITFLHFPPVWNGLVSRPIVDVLSEFDVKRVFFGHIHGNYTVPPLLSHEGIDYALISADFLNFVPRPIFPTRFFTES